MDLDQVNDITFRSNHTYMHGERVIMPSRYHVAILECDTPPPGIKQMFGSYGDLCELLLRRGLKSLPTVYNTKLVVSNWDVVNTRTYPSISDVDCVLLTGASEHSTLLMEC